MRRTSYLSASSRTDLRYSSFGGIIPALPITGSVIIAARSFAFRFQDSLKRDGIMPLCDNNGSRYSVRYSWIVRQFGGRLLETGDDRGRLDAKEDVVVVTMIVSFEFEDLVATSEGSCDANCLHCRLRARVGEADHLRARHSRLDLLGYLQFQLGGRAKHRPVLQLPVYRLEDRGMRVAEDDRAVA